MTLNELLEMTQDHCHTFDSGAKQVRVNPGKNAAYFDLDDYVVSSCVSGPSLILIERFK